jgi:hypothetical protein
VIFDHGDVPISQSSVRKVFVYVFRYDFGERSFCGSITRIEELAFYPVIFDHGDRNGTPGVIVCGKRYLPPRFFSSFLGALTPRA